MVFFCNLAYGAWLTCRKGSENVPWWGCLVAAGQFAAQEFYKYTSVSLTLLKWTFLERVTLSAVHTQARHQQVPTDFCVNLWIHLRVGKRSIQFRMRLRLRKYSHCGTITFSGGSISEGRRRQCAIWWELECGRNSGITYNFRIVWCGCIRVSKPRNWPTPTLKVNCRLL